MTLDPTHAGRDRQDLASALHGLRKASGLSGDRLARRCGISQSKVSRIETGRLLPSVVDVEQMLTALEVDDETRRGWWHLLALLMLNIRMCGLRYVEDSTTGSASWPCWKPTPH